MESVDLHPPPPSPPLRHGQIIKKRTHAAKTKRNKTTSRGIIKPFPSCLPPSSWQRRPTTPLRVFFKMAIKVTKANVQFRPTPAHTHTRAVGRWFIYFSDWPTGYVETPSESLENEWPSSIQITAITRRTREAPDPIASPRRPCRSR